MCKEMCGVITCSVVRARKQGPSQTVGAYRTTALARKLAKDTHLYGMFQCHPWTNLPSGVRGTSRSVPALVGGDRVGKIRT